MGKQTATLPVVNAHAAGIDIGSREHWVAVDQDKENVKSFGVYTQEHQHLIDYLRQYSILRSPWKAPAVTGKPSSMLSSKQALTYY